MRPTTYAILITAALTACTEPAPERTDTSAQPPATPAPAPGETAVARDTFVTIFFTRGDSTEAVRRTVPAATLEASLRELLRGPTEQERADGLRSWFSDSTANLLRSVEVDSTGTAIVDFADLRSVIPNASSSAGSTMLLHELNATVFAHPHINAVEYRMEGSCDAFGEWLQYGCVTMPRPE